MNILNSTPRCDLVYSDRLISLAEHHINTESKAAGPDSSVAGVHAVKLCNVATRRELGS